MTVITVILVRKGLATDTNCPNACSCKWKYGKQTVECIDRALITIPESINPETQVLDLSGNNLQILSRETFVRAGLLNLQRVFLRSCRIGQIDDFAFKGLTNLVELDLSHNLLTAIPSATFRDIPSLRDLMLAHNPIQKIDSHAFKNVPGLVKLDLSNCELQMIAPKAFEGVELLESLKINGNKLTELRPQTVETLNRLHGVDLHDNPWHCDCRLRAVKEWLTNNNIPYPIPPVCSGPERVIHRTFAELQIDEFACKPEILQISRYIEATAGDNATMVCRANAVPAAIINWYWNGRLLVNNSAFSSQQKIYIFEEGVQEKRSTLVLTNAQETLNEFYCVAGNKAGSAEANFTLRVFMRTAGMAALGSGQIAGLSAALVILILFILLVISVLLIRFRRLPFSESKTPGQIEVVTVVNGTAIPNGKSAISPLNSTNETSSFGERKLPSELNFCNPVQKPPRLNETSYNTSNGNGNGSIINSNSCFVSPSSGSGNNPDLINDAKLLAAEDGTLAASEPSYSVESLNRPGSGEYSRNADSLYPSGLWEHADGDSYPRHLNPEFHYDDKTPIIGDRMSVGASEEDLDYRKTQRTNTTAGYPSDYGLPIIEPKSEQPVVSTSASQINLPTNAKTLRVWQKGGVPVLPPVTALKRALTHSRNSPDEGYQEGCGTDV